MTSTRILATALNHQKDDEILAICFLEKSETRNVIKIALVPNTFDDRREFDTNNKIIYEQPEQHCASSSTTPVEMKWVGSNSLVLCHFEKQDGDVVVKVIDTTKSNSSSTPAVTLRPFSSSSANNNNLSPFLVTFPPSLVSSSTSESKTTHSDSSVAPDLSSRLFGVGFGENFVVYDCNCIAQTAKPLHETKIINRSHLSSKLTCGSFLPVSSSSSSSSIFISAVFGTLSGMEVAIYEAKLSFASSSSSSSLSSLLSCRGGGFIDSNREEFTQLVNNNTFQSSPFFQQYPSNHHCGASTILAVHPLDSSIVAVTHEHSSAIAIFDISNYSSSRPLMVVRTGSSEVQSTCKLGSRILNLFWHHSPADLLTVVSIDSVELLSPFSSKSTKNAVIAHPSSDNDNEKFSVSIFTHAAPMWWSASPSVICFSSTSTGSSNSIRVVKTSDEILDRFAPSKLLSLSPFMPEANDENQANEKSPSSSSYFLMSNDLSDLNGDDLDDDDEFENNSENNNINEVAPSSPFAFTLQQQQQQQQQQKKHHSHSRSHHNRTQSYGSFRYDKKEMENHQKFKSALNLSYKRRLNVARKQTLDLLNGMLDAKEKQIGAASAYSTDAAMRRRINDVISLALARSTLTAVMNSSSSSSSTKYQQEQLKIRREYSHNDNLLRFRSVKFAAARLNHLSIIPPNAFLGVKSPGLSSSSFSSSSNQKKNPRENFFNNFLATSSQIESDLATLSVRLTIANFVDSANCTQIVEHKALLARAIREGSISSQLTQRVFKLLLSQFPSSISGGGGDTNYIDQVRWILDNSVLLHHTFGTTSRTSSPRPISAVDDDLLDDEIRETTAGGGSSEQKDKKDKKEKKKKSRTKSDNDEEDEEADDESETDEESSDDDDSIQELENSVSRLTQAPNDVTENFWARYPMLAFSSGNNSGNKQRRLVFAILEILLYPLACDSENDDVGLADFLRSGAASIYAMSGGTSSAIAAASKVSSFVSPTVRKRDKKSARDCRRCLKVFIRDCAVASTNYRDPALLARIIHLALDLRSMEMNKWRNPNYLVFLSTSNSNTNAASSFVPITPAEECKNILYEFEEKSSGRGLSVIPSRYIISRYMLSLESCHKDAALLWMTSQLGNVHQMKSYSRSLAVWMNEYAEQHVTYLCDLSDVVNEQIEKIFAILEKFSTASSSSSQNNNTNLHNPSAIASIERELLRITNDLHSKLARLITAVYQGEAIFQRIPASITASSPSQSSPKTNNNDDDGNENDADGNENTLSSARGFMGEVLDKISDAMADSLGGWSELLTEVKQMNLILKAQEEERKQEEMRSKTGGMYRGTTQSTSKLDENMKLIATLVTKTLCESLEQVLIVSLNKLSSSLGEQIMDDTYQNIASTLQDFLRHAHDDGIVPKKEEEESSSGEEDDDDSGDSIVERA